MLAGHFGGEEVSLSKTFEAVGAYKAGMMDEATFYEAECNSCPGCGSCAGMYTANSMNCLSEAIGMALPGNGTTPAVSAARIHLAKHAGMKIMELIEKDIKPRDILTPAAFRNALTCEMAIGCSTNSVLHLLAIANEAGVPLQLETLNELSGKVPNICHLAPAGPHHIEQLYMAGGVPAIMKELTKRDFLDLSLITCTGKTVGENLEGVVNKQPRGRSSARESVLPDRRHRCSVGQHRKERLRCQAFGSRTGNDGPRGPGPRIRLRGGRNFRYLQRQDRAG